MAKKGLKDVLKMIIKGLNKTKLRWCLCGGIAANYYGTPRTTYDIDVIIMFDEKNICKLEDAVGLKKNTLKEVASVSNRYFWHIGNWRVDLWFAKSAFEKEIIRRRKKGKIDNLNAWLISVEDLIIQKLLTARPTDIEDIISVCKIKSKIDTNYVEHWCKVFNIKDRWEEIKRMARI